MKKYLLTEIGFDTTAHTESELIQIAQQHSSSYADERETLRIETLENAINYFKSYGFDVTTLEN